jgi:hypothetical protein
VVERCRRLIAPLKSFLAEQPSERSCNLPVVADEPTVVTRQAEERPHCPDRTRLQSIKDSVNLLSSMATPSAVIT